MVCWFLRWIRLPLEFPSLFSAVRSLRSLLKLKYIGRSRVSREIPCPADESGELGMTAREILRRGNETDTLP